MRALIQRVSDASVGVEGEVIGSIGSGLLILICAMEGDAPAQSHKLASKIAKLRIFRDEAGKMNRSLLDTRGQALIVSQFTLSADTRSGNRPGFSSAAKPQEGRTLYEGLAQNMRDLGISVETGRFGADMKVALTNDGPVTIWMDDCA